MARAELAIVFAAPLVTVQDAGRPGLMRFGVPASGPVDRAAFALANAALGNPPGRAAVEVSPGGLVLDCRSGGVTVALVGEGFSLSVNAARSEGAAVVTVRAGQRLSVRPGQRGSWAVLAFAGEIAAPVWLGSRATHSQSGLGGGLLVTGGRLTIDEAEELPGREGPIPVPPTGPPLERVRVVLGPQDRFFATETLAVVLVSDFAVTGARDRMGVRLSGPPLPVAAALDMPSAPVTRGSVQVAGDGVATVLLADHQTTGGYPRIATVIAPDLDRFAQLRPGARFRFVSVTPSGAVAATRAAAADLAAACAAVATPPMPLSQRLWSANLISGAVSGGEN